jgi:hypothetical protein
MYADQAHRRRCARHRGDRPAPGEAGRLQRGHGIDPQPLRKKINDILERVYAEAADSADSEGLGRVTVPVGGSGRNASRGRKAAGEPGGSSGVYAGHSTAGMARSELADLVQQLTDQMMAAARELQFELAGRLRDEIAELKREIRDMDASGVSTAGARGSGPAVDGGAPGADPDADDGRMPAGAARRGSRAMSGARRR